MCPDPLIDIAQARAARRAAGTPPPGATGPVHYEGPLEVVLDDVQDGDVVQRMTDGVWRNTPIPALDLDTDRALAASPDLLVTGDLSDRDSNGILLSAAVLWPDGDTGTYEATQADDDGVLAYTITKAARTFTQPPMTRDSSGAIVNRPPITET